MVGEVFRMTKMIGQVIFHKNKQEFMLLVDTNSESGYLGLRGNGDFYRLSKEYMERLATDQETKDFLSKLEPHYGEFLKKLLY